jgi:DNA-binding IclR family transcriptional regulator
MDITEPQTIKYFAPAVDRAISILELLAGDRTGGLGITDLSQRLRLPKSSVLAILTTMERRGFVRRLDNQKYLLGLKAYWIGSAYVRGLDLIQEFYLIAERIVAACGETVQLAVLQGGDVVYIATQPGTQPVRLVSEVGERLPAYASALGKALLAGLSDDEVRARFAGQALLPVTENTISSLAELVADLHQTRTRGVAIDRGEVIPGLYCVAGAVRNDRNNIIASMSISAPISRVDGERLAELKELILRETNHLSWHLGCVDARHASAGVDHEPVSNPYADAHLEQELSLQ